MVSYKPTQIRIPADKTEFEKNCVVLFKELLNDPNVCRVGTHGQSQDGVDIKGLRNGDVNKIVGIQCKLRSEGKKLTKKDVENEINLALGFKPNLSEYIIVTTAKNDTKLQQCVLEISQQQSAKGREISIEVWGWDTLQEEINKSEAAKKAFDPGFSPSIDSQNSKLQTLLDIQSEQPTKRDISQLATRKDISRLGSENAFATRLPTEYATNELNRLLDHAKLRRNFAGVDSADDFRKLADSIEKGELNLASPELKAEVYDRNARICATTNNLIIAKEFRNKASKLNTDWDLSIADALIKEAAGDQDGCLRMLRSQTDPESRTAMLIVLFRQKGDKAAFDWIAETNIQPTDLSAPGLPLLIMLTKDLDGITDAYELAKSLPTSAFNDAPVLFMLRAQITLASILPKGMRDQIFQGLPLNPRVLQFESGNASQIKIQEALKDLKSLLSIIDELDLGTMRPFLDEQILWLRLELVCEKDSALEKLAKEISDPELTIERVRLALSYGVKFDQEALLRELDTRRAIGGWNDDERLAAFLMAFFNNDNKTIISFLQKYKVELFNQFSIGTYGLAGIEVEALARTNQFEEAKQRITDHVRNNHFNAEQAEEIKKFVASLEKGDGLEYLRGRFENSNVLTDLMSLVAELHSRGDESQLQKYAPILARETKTFKDVLLAAKVLYQADQFMDVVDLAAELPQLFEENNELTSILAWSLFSLGKLLDAQTLARKLLAKRNLVSDRELVISCAVGSGDWAYLQSLLGEEIKRIDDLPADDLIRLAQLAQEVGSDYLSTFRDKALKVAGDNAEVYLKAYMLAMERGEDVTAAAGNFLQNAVDLSDGEGPIQKISLREVVELSKRNSESYERIDLMLKNAEIPMFLAAKGFNRQNFDLFLGQIFRNTNPADSRLPYPIFAFSGERAPVEMSTKITLALDITSIITLHYLGQFENAIASFEKIVIAPSTLTNLFAEKQFLKIHQPSELGKAKRILDFISKGLLKVINPEKFGHSLAKEVGRDLAGLLEEANVQSGLVVQTAPVHRVGSLTEENVDMSAQLPLLVDLHQILSFLKESGAIESHIAEKANAYFTIVDSGWKHSPNITSETNLYLDSLTVIYLEQFGLLQPILNTFTSVYIHQDTKDQATAVLQQAKFSERMLDNIEQIRSSIQTGINSGKISFSNRHMPREQDRGKQLPPETSTTMDLVIDVSGFQAIGVDDRCLNKTANWADNNNCSVKTVTTLDILNSLNSNKNLTEEDIFIAHHKLRKAGFYGVSVTKKEIIYFLSQTKLKDNGTLIITPEMRAIGESIAFPTLSGSFNEKEHQWLIDTSISCLQAIKNSWFEVEDQDLSQAQSNWILSILPNPFHFFNSLEDENKWHAAVEQTAVQFALLVGAIEGSFQARKEYYNWLEESFIIPLKLNYPVIWKASINRLKMMTKDLWTRVQIIEDIDSKDFFENWIDTLPQTVRSELLKDTKLVSSIDIKPFQWLQLSQNLKVTADSFHRAVRSAINGKKTATLKFSDGKTQKITLSKELKGVAILKIDKISHHIEYAGLFSKEKKQRLSTLDNILNSRSLLPLTAQKFKAISERRAFSINEFIEIQKAVSDTSEALIEELQQAGEITVDRLIPQGEEYYDALLAPLALAKTAGDFVEYELLSMHQLIFDENVHQAIRKMVYSAVWQRAIPFDLLSEIAPSEIEFLLKENDPYSLLLGIEICAEFSQKNSGFITLGNSFIEKLLLDEELSDRRCTIFSACAIISLAHVRAASKKPNAPTFWQRFVALSHAGVLTNGIFRLPNPDDFFQWSQKNFSEDCFWYNVVDCREAPGWETSWLTAKQVYAELFGRVKNVVYKISENVRPDGWVKHIETVQRRLVDMKVLPYAFFPGPMDPFGESQIFSSEESTYREIEDQIVGAISFADAPGIFLLANLTQPSEKVVSALLRLLQPENVLTGDRQQSGVPYLRVAATIACKCRSVSLANAVVDRCLIMLHRNEFEELEFPDIFGIMMISCAASAEESAYHQAVASVAERTCNVATKTMQFTNLLAIFKTLEKRDLKLASTLAKATSIANFRLGRGRVG